MNDEKNKDLNPELNNEENDNTDNREEKPDIDEVADSINEESQADENSPENTQENSPEKISIPGLDELGDKALEKEADKDEAKPAPSDESQTGEPAGDNKESLEKPLENLGDETNKESISDDSPLEEKEDLQDESESKDLDLNDLSLEDDETVAEEESVDIAAGQTKDAAEIPDLDIADDDEEVSETPDLDIANDDEEVSETPDLDIDIAGEEISAKSEESSEEETDISDSEEEFETTDIPDIDFGEVEELDEEEIPPASSPEPEEKGPGFEEIMADNDLSEDSEIKSPDAAADFDKELSGKEGLDDVDIPEEPPADLSSSETFEDSTGDEAGKDIPSEIPDIPAEPNGPPPANPKKKSKLFLIIFLLLIAGVGIWFLFFKGNDEPVQETAKHTPPPAKKETGQISAGGNPFIFSGAVKLEEDISDGITTYVYEADSGIDELYNYYKSKMKEMGYKTISEDYRRGMSKGHLIYLKGEKSASVLLRGTNQKVTVVVEYIK
ncbi:MAG: hypothetical protein PF545_06245 [Elusimicrobia bacterium]|jgi:hypothetical protein|nr:hypothetical protein [Elusimicrobiota bacterium]